MRKLVMLTAVLLSSSATFAVSLEEALTSGYNNHEDLKLIRTEFLDEIEKFPRALAGFMPKISAEIGVNNTTTTRKSSIAPGFTDPITTDSARYTKTIAVEQQIFNGGSSVAELKAAQSAFRASRGSYYAKEQDIVLREITTYLNCVESQEKYNISKISVKSNKAQLEAMKEKFKLGESTETEVATAQAGLSNAEATQSQNYANFEATKADFTRVFALDPIAIKMPPLASDLPRNLEEFTQKALECNPSIASAEHSQKSAKASEYSAKGALLPQISVRFQKGNTAYAPENTLNSNINNDSTTTALSVNIPILSRGGVEYSDVRRAKNQTRRSVIQLDTQIKQVKANCKSAWEAFEAAKKSVAATAQGVKSANIAYEGILQEEMLGSKTIIDVLTFEERLNNAKYSSVESQKALVLASYRIKSLTGELTANKMQLPVEYFDPDKEFKKIKLRVVGF